MRDFFSEHLIQKLYSEKDRTKKVRIIGITLAVAIFIWQMCTTAAHENANLANAFIILAFILIGIAIIFAYSKIQELHVEYEYAYIEQGFYVDVIKNRARRKNLLTVNVAEIEIMAHIDDKEHLAMYDSLPLEDLSSGEVLGNTYVFVASYNGKRKRFVVEPNDAMLQAFYSDLTPRRMFMKK
jgi:hypothetical protein